MPYSSEEFDKVVMRLFSDWRYKRYLDIGAGAGKYGKMIKSLVGDCHVTGVEVDKEYIENFDLQSTYDEIISDDIRTVIDGAQNVTYDVIIIGDIIEHLPKSDGLNLIHFYVYRCKRMLIIYPSRYVQYDVDGKKSESHRSVWGPQDFGYFEFEHKSSGYMNLVIVKGYLEDKNAILEIHS